MTTYRELEEKSMTPEKRAMAKADLGAFYIGRPISYVVTLPFLKANISATAVSAISALFALAALVVFLFADDKALFVIGWLLIFVWNILDGVDGNIARYTDTASPLGGLWDATVGWLATVIYYMGMGLAAWRLKGVMSLSFLEPYYFAIGCITAMCWIFPRLVMHKKIGLCGEESGQRVKGKENYGTLKLMILNITSVNGIGALFFLVAIVVGACDLCLLFYFAVSITMAMYSCAVLLRK